METPSHGIKPSDSSQVRATMEKEMDDCARDILSLKAAIIALDQKQNALKMKLNATSPFMAKLPLEIITKIFGLVIQSQDKHKPRLIPIQFLLGKICKAWREIVWTTPRLWAFIAIRFDSLHIWRQKRLFQECLDRSGSSLLHIFIACSTDVSSVLESIAQPLMKTCQRWRTLAIPPFPDLEDEMRRQSCKFPNLSSLLVNGQRTDDYSQLKYIFRGAPLLQKLQLSGCVAVQSMPVCWEKLVVVDIDSPMLKDERVTDAISFITRLKAVETLQIKIDVGPRNISILAPRILQNTRLPHLSKLKIVSTGEVICSSLNCITTPLLTSLEITHTDIHGGDLWLRAVEHLHQRSPFPLSCLSLSEAYITESDLLVMLQHLSSISSFSLSTPRKFKLSNEMIKHLMPDIVAFDRPDSQFLPNLTEFNYKGSISFSVKALHSMLEFRLKCFPRVHGLKVLRNLNITYRNKSWTANEAHVNPNQLQAFYRRLDNLRARGTTLNIIWDEKVEKPDKD